MKTTYEPQQIKQRWTNYWQQHQFSLPSNEGNPYCIVLPPPNVTGTLHMGHGFQHTLMDALIRRQRMLHAKTLWQPGTDHAGIATQLVVEHHLEQQHLTRHDLGRDKFIQRVWQWREHSGNIITEQMRRLGTSLDWTREHFSMDPSISKATREAFIRLFEEGLIYKGKRLVNWDPYFKTAISDLEVKTETEAGHLWYIRYPLVNSDEFVVVATTRPETMLGDTAVAVHPIDERFQHLIGKNIQLPLTERKIPVIADPDVDIEFGTGCVKITPAHDFNDYEMGKRHQLDLLNIMTDAAHLNDAVPEAYQGMERFAARKKIVSDLEAQGLLEKIEPYTLNVPRGERSGVIIEPLLTDQWYVKTKPLAAQAIKVVENGELKFVPANWKKTYLLWLENIQDWCISRQLWWGHQIPVWYDDNQKPYVGHDESDVRQRNQLANEMQLTQDTDVLDTWFTASLWPFSSLGWPDNTPELNTYYPTNVLVTGFDIIFFWVARMVMMGLKFMGEVPFREVYITGLIRDHQGNKMSKTKGNVLDPIDLIDGIELEPLIKKRCANLINTKMSRSVEKNTRKEFPDGIKSFGTDALRFTFCALASTGRDINFDLGRIEGYRNFCNKLWNAARYVFMNTENHPLQAEQLEYSMADRWIMTRLQHTIKRVNNAYQQYRFDLMTQALYEFTWNEYCDWYLELSKYILNNPNATAAELCGTRNTLLTVLETLLRLMHPTMPFITEEIWQKLAPMLKLEGESIMLQTYPTQAANKMFSAAEQQVEWLKKIITTIRTMRSEMGIAPNKKINILLTKGDKQDQTNLKQCHEYIKLLAKVTSITWHDSNHPLPANATDILNHLEIHIPLAGLIDKSAEIERLNREIIKLKKDLQKSSNKLNNPNYIAKAPAEVVAKERQRLKQSEHALQKLQEHFERIEAL